jgi:transcriptional regulator with XRE-family HTH domain
MHGSENHIGIRVRYWRLKRGISQQALAGLAGFTQSYVAQIEKGNAPLDKRSSQKAIAAALQVSVADLTGQPYDPQTVEHAAAQMAMPQVRAALLEASLTTPSLASLSDPELQAQMALAMALHNACRYDQLVPMLPGLLLELSARERPEDLRRRVWVAYAVTFAAKYIGYADLALLAAQYCRTAAAHLDEPAWTGVAEFALLHSLPLEADTVAERHADKILEVLAARTGDRRAAQVFGMVHLTAAMRKAVDGRNDESIAHLDEADAIAARVGEANFAQMWFGPTNNEIWRVGVYVELGEGARLQKRASIDPTNLGSSNRQATYFSDLGRGLAQTRRDDSRALAALLRAETIAPQRVRLSPAVRESVGSMLRRARANAGGDDLRRLARRMGTV